MTLEMAEEEKGQVLFRYDVTKDWLRKKEVHSYLVTNKHVVSGSQILNLHDIYDAVSLNEERVYDGGFQRIWTRSKYSSCRLGSYRGKGRVIGDVSLTVQHIQT